MESLDSIGATPEGIIKNQKAEKAEEKRVKEHNAMMDAKIKEMLSNSIFTSSDKKKFHVASSILDKKEYLSSGSLNVDYILGGGFMVGKVHEIWGNPSSGKTTTILRAIEEAQKKGLIVCYLDAEYQWDNDYARSMGINSDHVIVFKSHIIEEAIPIMEKWIAAGFGLIIIDSITALRTKKEIEDDFSKSQIAGNAKAVAKMIARIGPAISKSKSILIAINQVRMNMGGGAMSSPFPTSWTKKYNRPGGVAWEHGLATSLLLEKKNDVSDIDGEQKDLQTRGGFNKTAQDRAKRKQAARDRIIGHETMIACVKNRTAATRGMQRRIYIDYAYGLDTASEIFDFCIDFEFIEKVNRKQKYNLIYETGEMVEFEVSEKEMIRYIRDNKELKESLYNRCREAISEHLSDMSKGIPSQYYVDSHLMEENQEDDVTIDTTKVALGFS